MDEKQLENNEHTLQCENHDQKSIKISLQSYNLSYKSATESVRWDLPDFT